MANRLGHSREKDLFTTSMPNQWAPIEYATAIIINSWKEDFKSIQNLKADLTRKMTDRCWRVQSGEIVRKNNPR